MPLTPQQLDQLTGEIVLEVRDRLARAEVRQGQVVSPERLSLHDRVRDILHAHGVHTAAGHGHVARFPWWAMLLIMLAVLGGLLGFVTSSRVREVEQTQARIALLVHDLESRGVLARIEKAGQLLSDGAPAQDLAELKEHSLRTGDAIQQLAAISETCAFNLQEMWRGFREPGDAPEQFRVLEQVREHAARLRRFQ